MDMWAFIFIINCTLFFECQHKDHYLPISRDPLSIQQLMEYSLQSYNSSALEKNRK